MFVPSTPSLCFLTRSYPTILLHSNIARSFYIKIDFPSKVYFHNYYTIIMDAIFDYDEDVQDIDSPIQHFQEEDDVSEYVLDKLYVECVGCKRLVLPNVLCCDVDTFGKRENYLSGNYREWLRLVSEGSVPSLGLIESIPSISNIPKVYLGEV